MTDPEQVEHRDNRHVSTRESPGAPLNNSIPAAQDRLRFRSPSVFWLAIGGLLAGPLNPVPVAGLIALSKDGLTSPEIYQLATFGFIPCCVASGLCLWRLRAKPLSDLRLIQLAFKALALVTFGLLVILMPLFGTAALQVFVFGIMLAGIIGIPAALLGAMMIRIVVFDWKPSEGPQK